MKPLPTNAHREGSLIPIPARDYGHLSHGKRSWTVEDLVGMPMLGGIEPIGM